jgi:hypothetical protein
MEALDARRLGIKLMLALALVLIAIILASTFGALHNQVSYTISREYFTEFKFDQFNIINFPERLGASFVGIYATWWMGLVIGVPLSLLGLIHAAPPRMFAKTLVSFAIVICIAIICGTIGAMIGSISIVKTYLPEKVWRFEVAGFMHNASYIGGAIGLVCGIVYQIASGVRGRKKNG